MLLTIATTSSSPNTEEVNMSTEIEVIANEEEYRKALVELKKLMTARMHSDKGKTLDNLITAVRKYEMEHQSAKEENDSNEEVEQEDAEYQATLAELKKLMTARLHSDKGKLLDKLINEVRKYEVGHHIEEETEEPDDISVITTYAEYHETLKELEKLMNARMHSNAGKKLDKLVELISKYEAEYHPEDAIKDEEVNVIETDTEYHETLKEIKKLMTARMHSDNGRKLEALVEQISKYEAKKIS